MPSIEYDPRRLALYSPGEQETVFAIGQICSSLQLAVESARLAYIQIEKLASERQRLASALARVGFSAHKSFVHPETDTQAFGTYRLSDGMALISFRGTQPNKVADLATNLEANTLPWTESAGRVHAGFATAARGIMPQVEDWLDRDCRGRSTLILTGHSLGAALATLAASVWRPTLLVTLGSPRVGDATFAATVAGIDVNRIVDCCDAITEVPPEISAYTHIRPPSYITKDGVRTENPEAAFIASDRVRGRAEYFVKHAWKIGAVLLRDLADHAPINYVRAFF